MIITKRALSRRTVLRGFGAAVALPLLDAMVPAMTALAQTPARPVRRFGVVYVGNGAAMAHWTPADEGVGYTLSSILQPLKPVYDNLVVVSGLDNRPGQGRVGEPGGGHGRTAPAFLTATHAKPTEGADFRAGISIDQMVAAQLGKETELPSLEMQLEFSDFAGTCDAGFSCAYLNTISWRTPTTPVPMENNPRSVFERMFGDSGSTSLPVRLNRMRRDRSVLDSVSERLTTLQARLGVRDRARVVEYLDAIREVERRIQKAERLGETDVPAVEQPLGIPATYEEHARLMFDLQLLAYQADLTRVMTFMLAREIGARAYPEIGVPEPHHPLSHHQNDPARIAKLAKVNAHHVSFFSEYLQKLKATPDGDGSLLDHSLIVYGASMGNSNMHDPMNLPILVAGGANGRLTGGRHIRVKPETPLGNLWLTLLHRLDVAIDQVGEDGSGEIAEI